MNLLDILHKLGLDWDIINVGIVLVALGLIEITPIRINPISWILGILKKGIKGLGKMLNEDLYKEMDSLKEDVHGLSKELNNHINESRQETVRKWRADIMNFCNEEVSGKKHTKEQYEEIISSCDKYATYCEEKDIPNGVAQDSIAEIHRSYKELLSTDGFLKIK